MENMELNFSKKGKYYESEPIQVSGDFVLHLEFEDYKHNHYLVGRSATGENFVFPIAFDHDEKILDVTVGDCVEGLYIVVKAKNEPVSGTILG